MGQGIPNGQATFARSKHSIVGRSTLTYIQSVRTDMRAGEGTGGPWKRAAVGNDGTKEQGIDPAQHGRHGEDDKNRRR